MNRFFIYIVISILFFGCEKVVEFELDNNSPSITLSSFFNPDSLLSVTLFESLPVLSSDSFPTISDANVVVTELDSDMEFDPLIALGSGRYRSDFYPEPGKSYSIEVRRQGFETLFATDRVPVDTAVVSNIEVAFQQNGGVLINFDLVDNFGANFYELYIQTDYNFEGSLEKVSTVEFVQSDDLVFDQFEEAEQFLFFNDDLFEGQSYPVSLRSFFSFPRSQDPDVIIPPGIEIRATLHVRRLSEDLYQFKKSVKLQQDLEDDPFSEPVSIKSNVDGGLGIFGGFRSASFVVFDSSIN
jgi:hypothetical protein